ncbi:hypothetical protein [Rhizobium rhizogenes]|uniref:hypothetical protein n=1 Tax=Rhizobium rhizogenes TaxID=359 RepID=UPI0022CA2640|nr:hypothetical protein [Rhizobium rhizogenes]MCZ7488225.1 hypothetical protein [Rhizobium rhizogenes]
MTDRPILFSAPMIRALLAGTKTQTRRLIKPRGKHRPSLFDGTWSDSYVLDHGNESWRQVDIPIKLGDRLWVRETWAPLSALTHNDPGVQALADGGFYRADGGTVDGEISKWLPSIFMPRHASRLTLIVTDVRVERLNDISREDAITEGLIKVEHAPPMAVEMGCHWGFEGDGRYGSPISAYAALWDHINGAGAWESNPWIVAYTFTVHHGNIDQIAQVAA